MSEANETLQTTDAAVAEVKPKVPMIGSIVHFVPTNRKFSVDGVKWTPDVRAMIISGVEIRAGKTLCNGLVLRNGPDDQSFIMSTDKFLVPQDEENHYAPGTWHWAPRV